MKNNQMQIFENEELGFVRVVDINGEPWWVLKDVCDVLGIKQYRDTGARLDDDERVSVRVDTLGGKQAMTAINESGLYATILRSDKPNARKFRKWLTSEVLPAIRKNGSFALKAALNTAIDETEKIRQVAFETIIELLEEKGKNANLTELAEELAPKAIYCDMVLQAENAIPVSLIAKDYGYSAVNFNKLLHSMRIQYKVGKAWLLYQPYAKEGYTQTKTVIINDKIVSVYSQWTQLGRLWLYEKLKSVGIVPLSEKFGDDEQLDLF